MLNWNTVLKKGCKMYILFIMLLASECVCYVENEGNITSAKTINNASSVLSKVRKYFSF